VGAGQGLFNVTNKFDAAMEFMSNYASGDTIDFDHGSIKHVFEFLSAIVGPACYGDDLKERLKNNPTKTFLDIVARAEIALCLCIIYFCRQSWVHDSAARSDLSFTV